MSLQAPERRAPISGLNSPSELLRRFATRDDKAIAQFTVKATMLSRQAPFLSVIVLISTAKQYKQAIPTDLAS
jgi:hypothetical protein